MRSRFASFRNKNPHLRLTVARAKSPKQRHAANHDIAQTNVCITCKGFKQVNTASLGRLFAREDVNQMLDSFPVRASWFLSGFGPRGRVRSVQGRVGVAPGGGGGRTSSWRCSWSSCSRSAGSRTRWCGWRTRTPGWCVPCLAAGAKGQGSVCLEFDIYLSGTCKNVSWRGWAGVGQRDVWAKIYKLWAEELGDALKEHRGIASIPVRAFGLGLRVRSSIARGVRGRSGSS